MPGTSNLSQALCALAAGCLISAAVGAREQLHLDVHATGTHRSRTHAPLAGTPQQAGWPKPVDLGNPHPTYCDLDRDGDLEIVLVDAAFGGGGILLSVNVWHHDGQPADGWPVSILATASQSSVAIGNLDGDAEMELVLMAGNQEVHAFHHDGTAVTGFPFFRDSASSSTFGPTLTLDDLENDGDLEIVVPFGRQFVGGGFRDAAMVVLDHQGLPVAGWPHVFPQEEQSLNVAVGDLDRDGSSEIIVSALIGTGPDTGARIYVWDPAGNLVGPAWPVELPSWALGVALANVDGDGDLEILVSALDQSLYVFDKSGATVAPWPMAFNERLWGPPVVGEIDGDPEPEIVVAGENSLYALNHDATMLVGWPKAEGGFVNQFPALVDFDADGLADVVGAFGDAIYVYDAGGNLLEGPLATGDRILSGPCVVDLDGDGDTEIFAVSWDDSFYGWDLAAAYDATGVEWPKVFHDERNTSLYDPSVIFNDGFESGGTGAWSGASP